MNDPYAPPKASLQDAASASSRPSTLALWLRGLASVGDAILVALPLIVMMRRGPLGASAVFTLGIAVLAGLGNLVALWTTFGRRWAMIGAVVLDVLVALLVLIGVAFGNPTGNAGIGLAVFVAIALVNVAALVMLKRPGVPGAGR